MAAVAYHKVVDTAFSDNYSSQFDGCIFPAKNIYGDIAVIAHTGGDISYIISNKKYINNYIKFRKQYDKLLEYYKGISFPDASSKFSKSLSYILSLQPDSLSVELTYERSIFYSIRKGGYNLYIQHYLDAIEPGDDELIVSAFKSDIKLPSLAGSFEEVILGISDHIFVDNKFDVYSAKYELSY